MNLLITSIGKHAKIVTEFKKLNPSVRIITTSNSSSVAGAHFSDKNYVISNVESKSYLEELLDICDQEKINSVTTMLDIETEILSRHRDEFDSRGINLLTPSNNSAKICLDKYEFFKYVDSHNLNTILTFDNISDFHDALNKKQISFPVFVKPRSGRGSVGAEKVLDIETLESIIKTDDSLIIQEFIDGVDIDVDVYVDTISHKAVSMFAKEKIKKGIGGASQTRSYKDKSLFDLIKNTVDIFEFNGPVNIDVFLKGGEYYLTEINPRLGATYIHSIGAGVNFIPFIENNYQGEINNEELPNYALNSIMLTYNSAIIID